MKLPFFKELQSLSAAGISANEMLSALVAAVSGNNTLIMNALGRVIQSGDAMTLSMDESNRRLADLGSSLDAAGAVSQDLAQQILSAVHMVDERLQIVFEKLEPVALAQPRPMGSRTGAQLPQAPFTLVPTERLLALNPELRLLAFLRRYLSADAAIDVGAHKGSFSEFLLRCDYTVFAFEPNPHTFEQLVSRLGNCSRFEAFNFALGAEDGAGTLSVPNDHSPAGIYGDPSLYCSLVDHSLPEDLQLEHSIPVTMRSLSSVVQEGSIPSRVGVLKVDAEGYDLQVLKGASMLDAEIVMAEYWSKDSKFGAWGAQNDPLDMYLALRERGHAHVICFNRVHGTTEPTFYVNCPDALTNSWGNVVFFKDAEMFRKAVEWCHFTLRRVYFGTPSIVL